MGTDRSVLKRSLEGFASAALALAALCAIPAQAGAETAFVATPVGAPITVFDPKRDACDGHDVPDAPLRAYRGADDTIHAFGLHYENRRLSGGSLLKLRIECPVVFRATGNADPARHDDRAWIAATWTRDGKVIHALAHHEFQANTHKGRCAYPEYMKCWWNSILGLKSEDGGRRFTRTAPQVVAATPFPSEVGQGRHRGFFNPSNILERNGAFYTLIGTTGWNQQDHGVCLFRSDDLAGWRAYDGKGFAARFPDPYAGKPPPGQICKPIAPFPAPVGAVVKHRPSGKYLAIFQAEAGSPDKMGGAFPRSGFYLASSTDLIRWSAPSLVLATPTLYDNACGHAALRSYPVLIDERAETRNFEDIGDEALLFFSEMRIEGCNHTSDRKLIAMKLRISAYQRD
jgi:hypothetical protein